MHTLDAITTLAVIWHSKLCTIYRADGGVPQINQSDTIRKCYKFLLYYSKKMPKEVTYLSNNLQICF